MTTLFYFENLIMVSNEPEGETFKLYDMLLGLAYRKYFNLEYKRDFINSF